MDDRDLVSLWRFHYLRLKNAEGHHEEHPTQPRRRWRWRWWRRLMGKKRFGVRVSGLRKVFRRRKMGRKTKAFRISALKVSWEKTLKRLKKNHQYRVVESEIRVA
ncbi:hypothetical protein L2E82_46441 [Cichorium intybus]|uniref:Uncharacterized protein n=1 Tax=Cichorium intybus TaxID=13427 RepID=A0ACB8YT36_CICIN|nr:hypothetical protein L2E82_46441 [Cichorium intybus]